jgi:hypothetical protein
MSNEVRPSYVSAHSEGLASSVRLVVEQNLNKHENSHGTRTARPRNGTRGSDV